MWSNLNNRALAALSLSMLALTGSLGCTATSSLPAPGRVLTLHDPTWGRQYRMYVPSHYNDARRWPLVIACHGARPFDSPSIQIDEWKGLAEQHGFLVAAPDLTAVASLPPKPPEQIDRQLDDDRAILSIVTSIRAARSVDDTRVFLAGWSTGNYVALFSGLRHPDIFRAVSCREGEFKADFVKPTVPFLDHHQIVQVTYGELDLRKDVAEACIDWLREHDLEVSPRKSYGGHPRDAGLVYPFFAWVVRNRPWVRIEVKEDPDDGLRVTLSVRASFKPTGYLWDFGDRQRATEAAPTHRYAEPGTYTVTVGLAGGGEKRTVRHISLQVPPVHLGTALSTPGPSAAAP